MGEIVNVRDRELIVELSDLDGNKRPAQVNWIEDLGDGCFLAGLTYLGSYPYKDGSTEWILKLNGTGFKPLFCSLYWEPEKEVMENETKVDPQSKQDEMGEPIQD